MTVINALIPMHGQAGYILTDSLTIDEAGNEAAGAKVHTFPHSKSVMAISGRVDLGSFAVAVAELYSSFDKMTAEFSDAMTTNFARLKNVPSLPSLDQHPLELVVIGYSGAAKRIAGFLARSVNQFRPEHNSLILKPFTGLRAAEIAFEVCGGFVSARPEDVLLYLAKQQRTMPGEKIGGKAIFTELTETEIRQRIVHSWEPAVST